MHSTNELIHNPIVNDKLHPKNVNFIQDYEENVKDFSQITEGNVVMLPAFAATSDEMRYNITIYRLLLLLLLCTYPN